MEYFEMEKVEGGIHIKGFPDAVKMIRLDEPKAGRLADLALHKNDLDFALACLFGINQVPAEPFVLREALWRCAIFHLLKCFGGNKSRSSLSIDKVLQGDSEGKEIFKHFKNLRDKHLIHDENAYSQCIPGAVLNREGLDHKIAKIMCSAFQGQTLDQSAFSNLQLLITRSQEWVIKTFDELCDELTSELERQAYTELMKRNHVTYSKPKVEDIDKRRRVGK